MSNTPCISPSICTAPADRFDRRSTRRHDAGRSWGKSLELPIWRTQTVGECPGQIDIALLGLLGEAFEPAAMIDKGKAKGGQRQYDTASHRDEADQAGLAGSQPREG